MLKRILQILLLCLVAIVLTSRVAFSSSLPSGVLIADHMPGHEAANIQPAPSGQGDNPAPVTARSRTQPNLNRDRATAPENPQPTQANPSDPYDPYDFEVIREMNREIYREVQPQRQEGGR